ncbi:MAG: helix-turn-helix domain-containing protein [Clostridiales bacterium]|nr:helix-turn-helix domain-containing protein [Clostridiales bacterium]
MSRLGDLIKLERTRRGLAHKDVAKKSGVSVGYLMEVEAGTRIIRDDQARRILKTMGMEKPLESDFSLDDIASTVDLQSAMPEIAKARQKKAGDQQDKTEDVNITGSIWLDALSGVLQHVPIYNAVMNEVGSRLMPVKDGKVEGAPKDKVYYYKAPDDDMRGFRVHQGDLVLVVPASTVQDDTMMLIQTPQGKMLRMMKLLPRYQVMLQKYDQAFESEIINMTDLQIVGKCIRLEADLV